MKLQRVSALAKKEMKKTIREPAVLFMIFLFPIVFVLVFGLSFSGASGAQTVGYNVGLVNLDHASAVNATQILLTALSNTKIVDIHIYANNQSAQSDLSQSTIQAVIVIPPDFSQSLSTYESTPNSPSQWTNTTVSLYLERGSLIATQAIPPIIQQTIQSMVDQQTPQTPLRLDAASVTADAKSSSTLNYLTPGVFTFASIFLLMMVAQSFTQDRDNGMMKRIRTSPATSTEFMASQIISYMGIALIQAILLFALTYALGFRPEVGTFAYFFAFVLVLIFSVSNVGFGLIVATIARSSGAATGLSFIFLLPQMFLGTFVGMSLSSGAQVAGRFVPSYYVTNALTSIFLRGAALTSSVVLGDFAVVLAACVAILSLGVFLYTKYFRI